MVAKSTDDLAKAPSLADSEPRKNSFAVEGLLTVIGRQNWAKYLTEVSASFCIVACASFESPVSKDFEASLSHGLSGSELFCALPWRRNVDQSQLPIGHRRVFLWPKSRQP